ncbi:hypothetical protein [Spongiactinospora sp. TRM90649]|uniref:hypothetical protein n=1 Tax=Spongiactinospora sp. TRM90649 TaxID=3031114 RepID=UPI0023FA0F32|nr:hypothetical protein [Spongiactinospora sp. TRM90649]MDF5758478.1 hypothetical protein [Spongiactinospora sp. TRM90649]
MHFVLARRLAVVVLGAAVAFGGHGIPAASASVEPPPVGAPDFHGPEAGDPFKSTLLRLKARTKGCADVGGVRRPGGRVVTQRCGAGVKGVIGRVGAPSVTR